MDSSSSSLRKLLVPMHPENLDPKGPLEGLLRGYDFYGGVKVMSLLGLRKELVQKQGVREAQIKHLRTADIVAGVFLALGFLQIFLFAKAFPGLILMLPVAASALAFALFDLARRAARSSHVRAGEEIARIDGDLKPFLHDLFELELTLFHVLAGRRVITVCERDPKRFDEAPAEYLNVLRALMEAVDGTDAINADAVLEGKMLEYCSSSSLFAKFGLISQSWKDVEAIGRRRVRQATLS